MERQKAPPEAPEARARRLGGQWSTPLYRYPCAVCGRRIAVEKGYLRAHKCQPSAQALARERYM